MLLTIILCAALIGVDQFSKYLAVQHLQPVGTAPLVPGVIGLQYLENDGAAFSMLQGRQTLLLVVTGIALLAVLAFLLFRRPKNKWEYIALVLIFSGGAGNFIDRALNGYVVDFLNFEFMRFAVFNVADMFVVVGFVIFAVALIGSEWKLKKQREVETDEAKEKDALPAGDAADGND